MKLLLLWALLAAPSASDVPKRLAARAQGATLLVDDLRELVDHVGGRPTGSPACARAIKWGEAKLRAAGVDKVTLEPFTLEHAWMPGPSEAAATAPERFPLRVAASPGTVGVHAVEGRVAVVADAAALEKVPRGSIAIVLSSEMKTFGDLFEEYLKNGSLLAAAEKAHVAALLLQSTHPRGLLYRHPMTLNGTISRVPTAILSREHANRLARLADQGKEVRVRLDLRTQIAGATRTENVIGEIRGREKPDEVVVLGAHLDSWDLGNGAEDNGVNVALVIDAARAIASAGVRPRRTIRFVLFTGEEQGMLGSAAYVQKHAGEMAGHVANVIFDIGSGRTNGFYLNGRDELKKPIDEILAAGGLHASEHPSDVVDGTDNLDFLLSGVPNLVANQDPLPYLPDYHAESDTFERVNRAEAQRNAAIAAVLTWGLADREGRIAPRQNRAELDELIRKTKLDEQMKAFGQWEAWTAGKRAAPPK